MKATCSVRDCDKTRWSLGFCEMHYWRNRRHGTPGAATPTRLRRDPRRPLERFSRPSGKCWIWDSTLNNNGYGTLFTERRAWMAHRYVYTSLVGPIPVGLELDHLCRVRACVNPQHLEPVTRSENKRRLWAARRGESGHASGAEDVA